MADHLGCTPGHVHGSVAGPKSDPTSGKNYFEDLFLKLKITNKLFVSCSIISKHNQNNYFELRRVQSNQGEHLINAL